MRWQQRAQGNAVSHAEGRETWSDKEIYRKAMEHSNGISRFPANKNACNQSSDGKVFWIFGATKYGKMSGMYVDIYTFVNVHIACGGL